MKPWSTTIPLLAAMNRVRAMRLGRRDRNSQSPPPKWSTSGFPTGQACCTVRRSSPMAWRSSRGRLLSHSRTGSWPALGAKEHDRQRPFFFHSRSTVPKIAVNSAGFSGCDGKWRSGARASECGSLWSAVTCHRFLVGRLVAQRARDKSPREKAPTSLRTPNFRRPLICS